MGLNIPSTRETIYRNLLTRGKKMKKTLHIFMYFFIAAIFFRSHCMAEDIAAPSVAGMKTQIASFAEQMEVLPINIIAPYRRVSPEEKQFEPTCYRYDVTLKRYRVFYQFKKWVQNLTKEEFLLLPLLAEETTGKERSLVLMALYIYEMSYKPEFRPRFIYVYRLYETNTKEIHLTDEEWASCSSTYEKYKDDETLAFPAIKEVNDPETARAERDKANLDHDGLLKKIGYSEIYVRNFSGFESFRDEFPDEVEEILFLKEFCFGFNDINFDRVPPRYWKS